MSNESDKDLIKQYSTNNESLFTQVMKSSKGRPVDYTPFDLPENMPKMYDSRIARQNEIQQSVRDRSSLINNSQSSLIRNDFDEQDDYLNQESFISGNDTSFREKPDSLKLKFNMTDSSLNTSMRSITSRQSEQAFE